MISFYRVVSFVHLVILIILKGDDHTEYDATSSSLVIIFVYVLLILVYFNDLNIILHTFLHIILKQHYVFFLYKPHYNIM